MSYILTNSCGMGTVGSAATAGAKAGGKAGGGGSSVDAGAVVGAAGSALTAIVGGAINLANNIGLWRQQARDISAAREDAWSVEIDSINYNNLLAAQSAEELAAQNAVIEERNRQLAEQERIIGHEMSALEFQMRRSELEAERQQRAAAARQFRMPTWGWFAVAGVGVLAIAGAGAYMGFKSEES
jgi:hypothetical protein